MVFGKWKHGQEACNAFSMGYLLTELPCPNVGVVQPCESNSWAIGGSTHDLCGRSFWQEDMGLNCTQLTHCHGREAHPIFVDTQRLATCSCNVLRWSCDYDYEACDVNDTYYPPGSAELARRLLQDWSPRRPHDQGESGLATISFCGLCVVLGLGLLIAVAARRRRADQADYRRLA
ncbi:unnamed protein product [Symbiodinium pilosum]|uniref:Uncharacterized protein n=1 Tax=Symbiodinium pilosum TaxID=2952 RepID=A0A812QAH0_SYMPI|nr:unnamed protein product [Symbiodinium pilosum]